MHAPLSLDDSRAAVGLWLLHASSLGDCTSTCTCFECKCAHSTCVWRLQHGAAAIHYTITHSPLDKPQLLQTLVSAGADINLTTYVSPQS